MTLLNSLIVLVVVFRFLRININVAIISSASRQFYFLLSNLCAFFFLGLFH